MTPEPLKGKRVWYRDMIPAYTEDDIKSAVAGLIKFHEDRIEELIERIVEYSDWSISDETYCDLLREIKKEYESIMAIEHWLEDVI